MPVLADKIRHVIVLMMENRSFDHMLGHVEGVGDLLGTETNPSEWGPVRVSNNADYVLAVDPDHSHDAVNEQLQDAGQGFVRSYAKRVEEARKKDPNLDPQLAKAAMCGFAADKIPVMAGLARNFTVCRRWFASVPGETWPNRNYAHAATSHGQVNIKKGFYKDKTIFERLAEKKRSWRIYHEGPAQSWAFPKLWLRVWRHRFKGIDKLHRAIEKDELDHYSFVEPDYGLLPLDKTSASQHPGNNTEGPRDFLAGERLIASIYESLRARPAVFEKALLLITYDEHGGLFDHLPPPAATPPDEHIWQEGGKVFRFDRLGVRVPTILVSPWLEARCLDDRVFDHSSLVKSLRKMWMPEAERLTARDETAVGFHDLPILAQARTSLPELTAHPLPDDTERSIALRAVPSGDVAVPDDEFRDSLVALAGNVNRVLDAEGRTRTAIGTRSLPSPEPEWTADSHHVRARFGNPRELREYMRHVSHRFQAAVDDQALDLMDGDGEWSERPAGDDVRRAFQALAASPAARGKVSLRNAHDLVVVYAADGSLKRLDLDTGVEQDLRAPGTRAAVTDAATLADVALAALGRTDLL